MAIFIRDLSPGVLFPFVGRQENLCACFVE